EASEHAAAAVAYRDEDERLGHDPGLLVGQDQLRHGSASFLPSTIPRRQCPMYFAYSVRARSTSLVPLMIARPSGNTVNSCPSAWNSSRRRLHLPPPSASRCGAMSSKFSRAGVRCATCTALRPHRVVVCEPCSPSSHSKRRRRQHGQSTLPRSGAILIRL